MKICPFTNDFCNPAKCAATKKTTWGDVSGWDGCPLPTIGVMGDDVGTVVDMLDKIYFLLLKVFNVPDPDDPGECKGNADDFRLQK